MILCTAPKITLYKGEKFCYHVLNSDLARHSTFCPVQTNIKEEYRLTSGAAVWRPAVKRRTFAWLRERVCGGIAFQVKKVWQQYP